MINLHADVKDLLRNISNLFHNILQSRGLTVTLRVQLDGGSLSAGESDLVVDIDSLLGVCGYQLPQSHCSWS